MRLHVSPKRHRRWLLLVIPFALLGLAAAWNWSNRRAPRSLDIATGGRAGTYLPLGRGIAEILTALLPRVTARALETAGSDDNIRRLQAGEVDFAFVQNDSSGNTHVRTVARLYAEVLQVAVREDLGLGRLEDLRGRRISLGAEGGGTARVARAVLHHFGVTEDQYETRYLGPAAATAALHAGTIEAAFFLSGMKTPAVAELLEGGGMTLLSIGDAARPGNRLEGLAYDHPALKPMLIPSHTYGEQPDGPVGTVAVDALLVTRDDVPEALVRDVARLMFTNKVALADHHEVGARLTESSDSLGLRFPFHEGALAWYRRDEPSFLAIYAPALSLGFTLFLALGSAVLGIRQRVRQVKKERIDVYYLKLESLAEMLEPDTLPEALHDMKTQLLALRRQAFHELVEERLQADSSFIIFQDFIRTQLSEIDQRLARLASRRT